MSLFKFENLNLKIYKSTVDTRHTTHGLPGRESSIHEWDRAIASREWGEEEGGGHRNGTAVLPFGRCVGDGTVY